MNLGVFPSDKTIDMRHTIITLTSVRVAARFFSGVPHPHLRGVCCPNHNCVQTCWRLQSSARYATMIQLIVGTNRPGSNTRKVASQVASIYAELNVPSGTIDLARLPESIFSPSSYAVKPAEFRPFAEAVLESSGLVVVTPEYNGSIPGVLKYFIDMLKFPESFERRPVCFIGLAAGIWGAMRPVEQLQQVFGYRNAYLYPERVFLPQVDDLLDADGQLKDADLLKRLRKQAEGFVSFVECLNGRTLRNAA